MNQMTRYSQNAVVEVNTQHEMACTSPLVRAPSDVYRLCDLSFFHDGVKFHFAATLFYHGQWIPVCWTASSKNPNLRENALVRPYSMSQVANEGGRFEIGALGVLARPERDVCLFRTIPVGWGVPQELLDRMAWLVNELPAGYRHLLNAIFWDEGRLYRFCSAPASISHHHAYRHGLISHTVEVAEIAMRMCSAEWASADRALTLLAALLHDAGKADEYEHRPGSGWIMTDRGRLLGHDMTIVQWTTVAAAHPSLNISNEALMALLHVLTACRGAPEWTGLRHPAMIESELLSHADRFSGQADLHQRLSNPMGGWGGKHRAMRQRVYTYHARSYSCGVSKGV